MGARLTSELQGACFAAACICGIIAVAMLAPAGVAFAHGEPTWREFALSAGLVATLSGLVALATRSEPPRPSPRFAFVLVVLLWFVAPLAASAPLMALGMTGTDAYFEMVSGFTTTGSTVIAGLDAAPKALLLWRSMSHLLGGVGILALGVLLLPFLKIGGMQVFSVESSERGDRPLPRFTAITRSLMIVYMLLVGMCALAYAACGMSAFDAVNHAFATVSTGGFSTSDASMGKFEGAAVLWVGTIFMLAGSLPFVLYIAILFGRRPDQLDPQIVVLLAVIAVATLAVTTVRDDGQGALEIARTAFNVVSVISTTGFAAGDYQLWGPFAVAVFYMLTFLGGCAGSTTGGVKIYRLVVAWQLLRAHMRSLVSPSAITRLRYGKRVVDPVIFRSALVFIVAYALALMVFTIALGATGLDFLTAHTAALTSLSNVGPGLGPIIGPAGNFASLPDSAKWLCLFAMILGRLEILPVIVLLTPEMWRD